MTTLFSPLVVRTACQAGPSMIRRTAIRNIASSSPSLAQQLSGARSLASRPVRFFDPSHPSRPRLPTAYFTSVRHHPVGFFTSRHASSAAFATPPPPPASASTAAAPAASKAKASETIPPSLPRWLLGCSALVFGIVVIGGLTRLTESGLSIVEWNPITGVLPPLTDEQWAAEWDKYKVSPEGVLYNSKIDIAEFKKIFYMEWAHRIAGRVLGVGFIVPTLYYLTRYRLSASLKGKLLAIGLGIGFQGALGWYMVKSGLNQQIIEDKAPARVSQYRLAAHFGAALLLYIGMLTTALGLRQDVILREYPSAVGRITAMLSNPAVRRYKMVIHSALTLLLVTAISGAFVAGLDAGLVYNEFPYMGEGFVPPTEELMDKRYARREDGGDKWWRNILENPVTAQFDHRVLATTTFTLLCSLPIVARTGVLRTALPRSTRRMADVVAAAAVAQVTLGITTLLYLVPVPLAASHQAGSVVLLTCLLGLASTLRRPGRALRTLSSAAAKAKTL